ncbi:MAG: hypothetical protein ACYSR0_10135, partial [Planctomycetota bacterium]|jgi:hypothetical protein
MCVGLTLEEGNKVTAVLLGDSAYLLRENNPELVSSGIIRKHIETIKLLKHRVVVEKETCERLDRGHVKYKDLEIMDQSQIAEIISTGDVVITY